MRVIVCEDNDADRKKCVDMIETLSEKHSLDIIMNCYDSGEQMLFEFEDSKTPPDIVLLDINMRKLNGVDVAKKLREMGCMSEIIFLTNSETHWSEAFDIDALNYILKGKLSLERFETVFMKAVNLAKEKQSSYIICTGAGESRNVPVAETEYFEVIKRIVIVHYNSTTFEFYSTLGKIENQLENFGFVRIHKSYLVSISKIASFSYDKVVMRSGETLPVGRKYYTNLKNAAHEKSIQASA